MEHHFPEGIHDSIEAGSFNLPQPTISDLAGNEIKGYYEVVDTDDGQQLFIWFDYSYLQQAVYPVMIDPTVIIASNYSFAGVGDKLVYLSNGWIVAMVYDSTNTYTRLYLVKMIPQLGRIYVIYLALKLGLIF